VIRGGFEEGGGGSEAEAGYLGEAAVNAGATLLGRERCWRLLPALASPLAVDPIVSSRTGPRAFARSRRSVTCR
jgi:hypothetical protein